MAFSELAGASAGAGRLVGRRALVTGAGSDGIGRAIVLAFLAEGAEVVVHYRSSREPAERIVEEASAAGRRAVAVQADLRTAGAARGLVQAATDALGGLDLLVCSAATIARAPFLDITDDEWDDVQETNLRAYFACGQEMARHLVGRGSAGRIIFISSINQQLAPANAAHYNSAKGGILQLARSMALELAPHGITVNVLAPGNTETDFNRHLLANPEFRSRMMNTIPMGRVGTPHDMVGAAVFLAGDESAYITGASITIDGGLSLAVGGAVPSERGGRVDA